jgi:hypothetical protein
LRPLSPLNRPARKPSGGFFILIVSLRAVSHQKGEKRLHPSKKPTNISRAIVLRNFPCVC